MVFKAWFFLKFYFIAFQDYQFLLSLHFGPFIFQKYCCLHLKNHAHFYFNFYFYYQNAYKIDYVKCEFIFFACNSCPRKLKVKNDYGFLYVLKLLILNFIFCHIIHQISNLAENNCFQMSCFGNFSFFHYFALNYYFLYSFNYKNFHFYGKMRRYKMVPCYVFLIFLMLYWNLTCRFRSFLYFSNN